MMENSRPRWSSATKITVIVVILVLGGLLMARFRSVFPPLIIAVILAYIFTPIVRWTQNKLKIRRGLATLLAYIIALTVLAGIFGLIIPPLAIQLSGLNLDLQTNLERVQSSVKNTVVVAGIPVQLAHLVEQLERGFESLLQPVLGQTLGFAVEVITSIVWIVFIFVVSFYLTKDAPILWKWINHLVPPQLQEDYQRLSSEIRQIWAAFFRGQLVLATVVTMIFTGVGLLIGLPFALAMGVLAGLLEFLPSVGHVIWMIIAALLALFAGSTWLPLPNWVFMLVVIGLQLTFQQFDINYLIPRIIGRRVHLPPVVVILGIVAGAALAGVLGIFLAAPTIASLRVIGHYVYANLFDMDPFRESVALSLPPPNPRWWERLVRPVQRGKNRSSQGN